MKVLPFFFFFCLCFPASGQIDSLQHLPLDSLIDLLSREVSEVNNSQRYAETRELAFYALGRAQKEGDPALLAEVHQELGNWHYYSVTSNDPDSVYYHDVQVLNYLQQTDNQQETAAAARRVGMDLVGMGRYREAEEYIFEAIAILEAIDLPLEVGSTYSALNYLYRESKAYEQALIYGEKSLALFSEHGESEEDLIEPLLGLIFTYPEVEQAEKGLEKAEQVVRIIGEKYDWADNVHLANVRSWRGEAHVAVGNYQKALVDFIYGWEVIQTIVPEPSDADGWRGNIGNVLRLQGKYAEAIPHVRANLEHHLDRNIDDWELVENNQFWLAECYTEIGLADSALFFLAEAQKSQKKRLTEELAAVQNELRIKYDSDQKEVTIANQELQIRQQKRAQKLTAGIVVLLTLLLGSLYWIYQTNRKRNRQLSVLNADLQATNQELDIRNQQNELLLQEIHHRVKNNLEVISGLLELQSAETKDEEAQQVMRASQSRVESMSIIHQKLYQLKNLAAIEMKDYFRNLTEGLLSTYDVGAPVEVKLDMDPLEVDVDTAVPIGLIVNELLTNALKYAFPDGEAGKLTISLRALDTRRLELVVADNGIGKAYGTPSQGTGFGSQLIRLLTRQLNGVMQEQTDDGTRVTFRLERAI